jgi:hypothetical protein
MEIFLGNLLANLDKKVMSSFSPSFKFKIFQKFKISQAKVTKQRAVNYFCLADFKFLTDFKFKTGWEIARKNLAL